MMSGHALLKILTSFTTNFLKTGKLIMLLALVPWLIVNAVYVLESLISALQAYVFAVLLILYTADMFTEH